jgi:toxin ParE1/3/4
MARPWRLTRRAETALLDIALWTHQTFGPRQAAAYEEDLITRCRDIASGTAQTQDCRRLIDPDLPENLRFARAGQHFIVFVEDDAQVTIIDFLHNRTDLPGRLAEVVRAKPDQRD